MPVVGSTIVAMRYSDSTTALVFNVLVSRTDLVGDIVAVLLGVEHAPSSLEGLGPLGPQDPCHRGIPVRDMDARELIITVVLEAIPRHGPEGRIERGRDITALRDQTQRQGGIRITVIGVEVKEKGGVQGVMLRMQRIAAVLHQ